MLNENAATVKILYEMVDLLNTKGWCQQAFAKDRNGRDVNANSEYAASYSIDGALYNVCLIQHKGSTPTNVVATALQEQFMIDYPEVYKAQKPFKTYAVWQDDSKRTKQDVIGLIHGAAERLSDVD